MKCLFLFVLFAWPHFDAGWWARAHWTAAAFDYSATGAGVQTHPWFYEVDPAARFFTGRRPQPWKLGVGWSAECAAVSLIPNKKLRRIVQLAAIGGHVYAGIHNARVL